MTQSTGQSTSQQSLQKLQEIQECHSLHQIKRPAPSSSQEEWGQIAIWQSRLHAISGSWLHLYQRTSPHWCYKHQLPFPPSSLSQPLWPHQWRDKFHQLASQNLFTMKQLGAACLRVHHVQIHNVLDLAKPLPVDVWQETNPLLFVKCSSEREVQSGLPWFAFPKFPQINISWPAQ